LTKEELYPECFKENQEAKEKLMKNTKEDSKEPMLLQTEAKDPNKEEEGPNLEEKSIFTTKTEVKTSDIWDHLM